MSDTSPTGEQPKAGRALSRRQWLLRLAGRTAEKVADAVEDRIPEPLPPAIVGEQPVEEPAEIGEPEPPPTELRLNDKACIAIIGIDCGACARLCPEGVRGLWLRVGKPVVDPQACVGCGECVRACPSHPKALRLVELKLDAEAGSAGNGDEEDADETPERPDFSAPDAHDTAEGSA